MEINDIIRLMEAVSNNGLTSFKLEEGNLKLSIKKENEVKQIVAMPAAPAAEMPMAAFAQPLVSPVPAAGPQAAAESVKTGEAPSIDSDKVVSSPLVGTFYDAASPDADPFVKVGDTVKKGQTLGIIEAMKLMNEIECEYDGVIEAILVSNEDVVEYGQPLFRIR